jgi:hypothetical protein
VSSPRILGYAYGALGTYVVALVALTSMTLTQLLPALVQLLLCGGLFAFGYSLSRAQRTVLMVPQRAPGIWRPAQALVAGLAALLASILSAQYSTGLSPMQVFAGLGSNQSLYVQYQGYTRQLVEAGGGGAFTIWFALQVVSYAIAVIAIMSIVGRGGPIAPQEWTLLGLSIAGMAYSGLARGTGLEFFHIGSVLLFAMLSRMRSKRVGPSRFYIAAVALGLASIYVTLLAARGVDPALLDLGDIRLEESWLRALLGPGIVGGLLAFYSYFGFGSLYVATFWSELWLRDGQSILLWLLPGGSLLGGVEIRDRMNQVLDVGVRWHPDSVLLAANIGMMGLFAVCVLLGKLARELEARTTLASTMLRYFIFLQMLAFPVGNFVWIDKAPLVVVVWLLLLGALRGIGLLPPTFRQFFFGRSGRIGGRSIDDGAVR